MSLGFATVHLVRYIKLFTKVVVSFSLLPAEQGNYIFMFHIRGQQTFSVKSHIIHMLGFSTKWQNRATILHESLIAFLYFSLKYVKTIWTYGLYKGRWQSRFGLWAGICQSCSVSLSVLDIIRCLTWPRDQTRVSSIAGRCLPSEPPGKPGINSILCMLMWSKNS